LQIARKKWEARERLHRGKSIGERGKGEARERREHRRERGESI
jgi:hypothetical protein